MSVHLQREIEKVKQQIVLLGGAVEKNLGQAMQALASQDETLARQVSESDPAIDQWEVDIEEECLKILALHQPVANDLRFLVAVLKINNDLERIGDEAVNIAERVLKIIFHPKPVFSKEFTAIGRKAQEMLKYSLDALVTFNIGLAQQVRREDDVVDGMVRQVFATCKEELRRKPEEVEALVEFMRICRHLERIADHATNIAEDVIYMIEGTIVRHRSET
jgi:phosphate transport system protein